MLFVVGTMPVGPCPPRLWPDASVLLPIGEGRVYEPPGGLTNRDGELEISLASSIWENGCTGDMHLPRADKLSSGQVVIESNDVGVPQEEQRRCDIHGTG